MIKRPLTLNRWFGIKYRIHPLFSLIVLFSMMTGYFIEIATLFGIVFVHELGHVVAAKGFGWRVKEVQLLPFGGVAVVEESGGVPVWQELVVTIAGPLQNLWMMLVGYGLTVSGVLPGEWGLYFVESNLLIALFNLLPVMPLDGGKLMQLLISLWLPYQKTIQITYALSFVFSLCFIGAAAIHVFSEQGGIQLNWMMIGLFLFYSNWHDFRSMPYHFMRFLVHREARLKRLWSKGTIGSPIVVHGRRKVADIVRLFMREKYHLIYILDEFGEIRHVVTERTMLDFYFNETKRGKAISELFA